MNPPQSTDLRQAVRSVWSIPAVRSRQGTRALPTAHALQLAGIQPLSTVDWPGKLVATVFAQGCPWACGYCHNHAIIDCLTPGVVPWTEVVALMRRRQGLLDGIVFSGGEATRQAALFPAVQEMKDMGFEVGLHSAGPYPSKLRALLGTGYVDWVGLDVKATTANYPAVVGRANAGQKAWESLDVMIDHAKHHPDFNYEVRLTVFPNSPGDELEVAQACKKVGASTFALQQARQEGAPSGFIASTPDFDQRFEDLVKTVDDIGFRHLIVRRA